MNGDPSTRALWTAVAGSILAWPIGQLVGLTLVAGQDVPGSALAQAFGTSVMVAVWGISVAAIIWNLRKGLKHLGKSARAIVVLSIVCLPAVAIVSAANYQVYDLRIWNESGAKIDNVTVGWAERRYSFGVMSNGVTATKALQRDRPEGSAEIRWTGEDGQSHIVEIDLSETVPRRYNKGILTFTISAEQTVKVDFFIPKEPVF